MRRKKSILALLTLLALLVPVAAQALQQTLVPFRPVAVPIYEVFTVLSYDTLAPQAATLQFTYQNPARKLTETRVDNESDFDTELAKGPDSVLLVTDEAYAAARHGEFLGLGSGQEMNLMVAVYGNINALRSFVTGQLGVTNIAQEIVAPGTTDGMLIIQYVGGYNFAYLLGEETYSRGGRATYPSTFPIERGTGGGKAAERQARGPFIYIVTQLIEAALEEPFWNRMHYLSGHTLGCLGLDWDTAFGILWEWELFEQWLNSLGFEVGEDIWGVIWDLIWGMVGYIDGATGWWD